MLKAAVAATLLVCFEAGPAGAAILVTGAIRDRAGDPVTAARVTVYDASGRLAGTDVSAADGTFAVDAAAEPAALAIACAYCEPVRRAIAPGEPVVVIIDRHRAIAATGPTVDDIAALPLRSAVDIASLVPFTIVTGDRIADRGLAYSGAVLVAGLPFYDAADGGSAARLIPAFATAGLTAASPLAAPAYGGYAAAGAYDFALDQPGAPPARADLGGAADLVTRLQSPALSASYAGSVEAGDGRTALDADAAAMIGSGRGWAQALDLAGTDGHASGAGAGYVLAGSRDTAAATISVTQTDASSLVTFGASLHDRGPIGLQFGVRALRATADFAGSAAVQSEVASYVGAARSAGIHDLAVTVGWDSGSDANSGAVRGSGLVGMFADDLRLASHWSAHVGGVTSLRIPTFAELPTWEAGAAVDRSALVEASLAYTDVRRLRVAASAYRERTTGPAASTIAGVGIDTAWQIAPEFALRSWVVAAHETTPVGAPPSLASYGASTPTASGSAVDRSLIWFTYDNGVRIDALLRSGPLEGDVRIPIGALYALALGTARYDGRRFTTIGLVRR